MAKLLVVYHAPSPNMERLVDAVIAGTQSPDIHGVEVRSLRTLEAGGDDLLWCDGVLFGTTENFGYMSGALKDFFERSYYHCLDKVAGRPYALFVKAGNDGTGAVTSVQRIVTGLDLKPIADPLLMVGDFREDWLEGCAELGMTMAAGLEAGIF